MSVCATWVCTLDVLLCCPGHLLGLQKLVSLTALLCLKSEAEQTACTCCAMLPFCRWPGVSYTLGDTGWGRWGPCSQKIVVKEGQQVPQ